MNETVSINSNIITEFHPPLPLLILPYCFISLQSCELQFNNFVLPCFLICGSQPVFNAFKELCMYLEGILRVTAVLLAKRGLLKVISMHFTPMNVIFHFVLINY